MPLSKRRKKKGKVVRNNRAKRTQRIMEAGDEQPSGVTLQDLINMVAYQEMQEAGIIDGPAIPDTAPEVPTVEDIDFENPDTEAVIRAVEEAKTYKVNEKENADER